MNNEYEYSFKSSNIEDFINYCKKNNYRHISTNKQIRNLYKGTCGVMARITENIYDDYSEKILDLKEDNPMPNGVKIHKESKELIITKETEEFVNSLIEILGLSLAKSLHRTRYIYEKENVKFEIDDYTNPLMKVVGIEGVKEDVDKVVNELKDLINKYEVKEEN